MCWFYLGLFSNFTVNSVYFNMYLLNYSTVYYKSKGVKVEHCFLIGYLTVYLGVMLYTNTAEK